jgi:hypothetical protein
MSLLLAGLAGGIQLSLFDCLGARQGMMCASPVSS